MISESTSSRPLILKPCEDVVRAATLCVVAVLFDKLLLHALTGHTSDTKTLFLRLQSFILWISFYWNKHWHKRKL